MPTGAGAVCVCTSLLVFILLSNFCLLIILTLTFVLQLHSLVKRSSMPGTAQGRHWS